MIKKHYDSIFFITFIIIPTIIIITLLIELIE
jgi:hypothetical protein